MSTSTATASVSSTTTSRVQLALNVSDLEASVAFYSAMFGVQPHKRRPGYANFAIAEPPLKLVLIETSEATRGSGTAGALNHLGVEVGEESLFVRLPDGGARDVVWRTAAACGEQVRYLRPQRSTLEEVFLKTVDEGVA